MPEERAARVLTAFNQLPQLFAEVSLVSTQVLNTFDGTADSLATYLSSSLGTKTISGTTETYNVDGTVTLAQVYSQVPPTSYYLATTDDMLQTPNPSYMEARFKFIAGTGYTYARISARNGFLTMLLGIANFAIGPAEGSGYFLDGRLDTDYHTLKIDFVDEFTVNSYIDGVLVHTEVVASGVVDNSANFEVNPIGPAANAGIVLDYVKYVRKF